MMWRWKSLLSFWLIVQSVGQAAILIKGGTVVNADQQLRADVLVKDGLIRQVAAKIEASQGIKVIDASGKYVMPGGIDPHTHLDAPFMGQITADDFYSGHQAALAGGTTMHIDFALPPPDGNILKAWDNYQAKTRVAAMDFGLHIAITKLTDEIIRDMAALVKRGINSFKFFMAYKGALQVSDTELIGGFQRCKELGAIPMVHAENGDAISANQQKLVDAGITGPAGHYISRPDFLEDEATYRAIVLAKNVNVPLYVVHVMSGGAAGHIGSARAKGQRVIGEAVASGIAASEASAFDPDFKIAAKYVMSPPIRSEENQKQIRGGLAGGSLQLIATDHAVFNISQKAHGFDDFRKIPNGVNGIEERLHVTWDTLVRTGFIAPQDFVRITSTACAQIFNIYPQKGVIAAGSDADIIIFDPNQEHTISAASHHSAVDSNIYEGRKVKGKVILTISRGKVVWDGKQLHTKRGIGRLIERKPFGTLYEGNEKIDAIFIQKSFPYELIPQSRLKTDREEL